MISGISSTLPSYSSLSSSTASSGSNKFQEDLLARLDSDGDGAISKDELNSALSPQSRDGVTVSLSQAFSDLDSDGDDTLDADELASMTPPPPPMQPSTDLAQDLLGSLDADGDGAVNNEELTAGISAAGSDIDASQVFDALDTNEDGTVSLQELTASLQPQSGTTDDSELGGNAQMTAQALSRMVAALDERYSTDGSKPVGKYLDTAA